MSKTILMTGGTGLVGTALREKLEKSGHSVRVLVRDEPKSKHEFHWDLEENELDDAALEGVDTIIHLAGESVAKRWTERHKRDMFESRVSTAYLLLAACRKKGVRLDAFISASGINYYGTYTSDSILSEEDEMQNSDFLAELTHEWERAASSFSEVAKRVIKLRTSTVLSNRGGAFPMLRNIADKNLAAAVGSGKQWMNWIHLADLVGIYQLCVEKEIPSGAYNATSDQPVKNAVFMKELAKKMHKIYLPVRVPELLLGLAMGNMSDIILEGTRASNDKIKEAGYSFRFGELDDALDALIQ